MARPNGSLASSPSEPQAIGKGRRRRRNRIRRWRGSSLSHGIHVRTADVHGLRREGWRGRRCQEGAANELKWTQM